MLKGRKCLCDLPHGLNPPRSVSLVTLVSTPLSGSLSLCNVQAADVPGGAPGLIRSPECELQEGSAGSIRGQSHKITTIKTKKKSNVLLKAS